MADVKKFDAKKFKAKTFMQFAFPNIMNIILIAMLVLYLVFFADLSMKTFEELMGMLAGPGMLVAIIVVFLGIGLIGWVIFTPFLVPLIGFGGAIAIFPIVLIVFEVDVFGVVATLWCAVFLFMMGYVFISAENYGEYKKGDYHATGNSYLVLEFDKDGKGIFKVENEYAGQRDYDAENAITRLKLMFKIAFVGIYIYVKQLKSVGL